jgi:ligand-binding SRPBCC domain-containing protein
MRLAVPRAEVFAFFADATNLALITPPEVGFRMRTAGRIDMRPGTLIDYTIRLHGIPLGWRTEITRWEPPREFADVQVRGPYALWVHTHRFRDEAGETVIEDDIRYALPFGGIGRLAHPLVRRQLARIFSYRQTAVERHFRDRPPTAGSLAGPVPRRSRGRANRS